MAALPVDSLGADRHGVGFGSGGPPGLCGHPFQLEVAVDPEADSGQNPDHDVH